MAKVMSHEPNLIVSRYTDLRHEPITRLLTPITAYQATPQVSLEESIKPVSHSFNGIEGNVWVAKENSKNPANGLNSDESASIQLYTMQFDSEPSLYKVLNKALCDENRQSLRPWAAFLKLFLTALHKLPSCAQTVWRGVRGENLSSKYPTGSRFAWWGVSSCTAAIEVLENDIFLGRTDLRTLFSIECKNGKSVAAHSYFKENEKEVILIPGSYFEVVGQLNPAADLCIIHLKEIDPPVSLVELPFDMRPFPAPVKKSSDNQRVENDASNVSANFKEPSTIPTSQQTLNAETIVATIMPYLFQLPTLMPPHDQRSTEVLVESMRKEEQRMEKALQSMKPGEERMKLEIRRMKLREKRMEHEIKLMDPFEKPVEEISAIETSLGNDENSVKSEVEDLKQREEHMKYEISRIEHYKNRLQNEIQSMKHEIERVKNRLMVIETAFGHIESHDELHQIKTKLTNRENEPEELRTELEKREMRLAEYLDELKKRKTKCEEHRAKRMECENRLENLRKKIKQEKERREREKQLRIDAIKRRERYEKELKTLRAERVKCETELSEYSPKYIVDEVLNAPLDFDSVTEHYKICKRASDFEKPIACLDLERGIITSAEIYSEERLYRRAHYLSPTQTYHEASGIIEQPKYDIFISFAYQDDSIIGRIKNALPSWYSIHVKGNFSSANIKTCLDNTSAAVIAIINTVYEIGKTCQADIIHIFKRQFPLVFVVAEEDFKPTTDSLNLVWHASNTQKVFLHSSDFEENLRSASTNAQWNLSPNANTLKLTQPITVEGANRFLGDVNEWTIAYNNPAQVSHYYRQLITDPLRITTDTKLRDFYDNYIRMHFKNPDIVSLIERGAKENDIRHFIRAYTLPKANECFSEILNRHLSANILFYFEPILYDTVDYRLVKSLIDFAALCIFRQELQEHLFTGTVYRGMIISEADFFKYIVGSRVMNTSFLSTSKRREVANIFTHVSEQEYGVVCTYEIHNKNKRRTAVTIAIISIFPDESEILILPFSAFYVKSVTRSPDKSKPIEITLVEDDYDVFQNDGEGDHSH